MTEELLLNGNRMDVEQGLIRINYQNTDIGEFNKRRVNYSNSFKLPKTTNNIRNLEYLGLIGGSDSVAANKITANYLINDIYLIKNGTAKIKKIDGEYSFVLYDEDLGFFEEIKGKNVNELDFSSYNHSFTRAVVKTNMANTEGFLYAVSNYREFGILSTIVKNSDPTITYDLYRSCFPPVFFEYSIIEKIIEDAGYTHNLIFSDEQKEKVIPPTASRAMVEAETVNLNEFLPNIDQFELLKDFISREGYVYSIVDNHITFKKMEAILSNSDAEDWSSKFTGKHSTKFKDNYAVSNNFKYKDGSYTSFSFEGNDPRALEKTIYQSIYSESNPVALLDDDSIIRGFESFETEIEPRIYSIRRITRKIQWSFFNNEFVIETFEIPELTDDNLKWNYLAEQNYKTKLETSLFERTTTIEAYLNINDINTIDLFKTKWIDALNGYYFINKIPKLRSSEKIKIEAVRVINDSTIDFTDQNPEVITPPVLTLEDDSITGDFGSYTYQSNTVYYYEAILKFSIQSSFKIREVECGHAVEFSEDYENGTIKLRHQSGNPGDIITVHNLTILVYDVLFQQSNTVGFTVTVS